MPIILRWKIGEGARIPAEQSFVRNRTIFTSKRRLHRDSLLGPAWCVARNPKPNHKMNIDVLTDSLSNSKLSSRRQALRRLGLGAAGLTVLGALSSKAHAQQPNDPGIQSANDIAVLQFALNLEYLEAEFYTYAVSGHGIEQTGIEVTGQGNLGPVLIKPDAEVPFMNSDIRQYAEEIARDERDHVRFIRSTLLSLGVTPVARPTIDLRQSFNALAQAAGLGATFDPFAGANRFLLGAFIFEDVGVTAYRGGAPLLNNPKVLSGAAGLLGTEAYHAANIRAQLFALHDSDVNEKVQKISKLRDALDGSKDRDQGIIRDGRANIVPTNGNGLVFARTVRQVLNILYFAQGADMGGFFPNGINSGS